MSPSRSRSGGFSNVSFLFNVTGSLICNGCQLQLQGTLKFSDVLFNVIGTGDTVEVFKEVGVWPATILACERDCVQDHAKLFGSWICGFGVKVHSGALVCPPDPILNP